jgi:hypothetical protein
MRARMNPRELLHFSEDPTITIFQPRVLQTNPSAEPLVWAIDAEHAPLYWFPRDCPRVAFWAGCETPAEVVERHFFGTAAQRVHAIECAWLERVRNARLYAYRFSPELFERWEAADGHRVARQEVVPLSVEPVGDLLQRHADAEIELRITPSLWPLHDMVLASGLRFSMVRMRNASPRENSGGLFSPR